MIRRIINACEEGAESAALRYGLIHGLEVGGTAREGFAREGGTIPAVYRQLLGESSHASPTRIAADNIHDADGALVLVRGEVPPAVRVVADMCLHSGKPFVIVDIEPEASVRELQEWLIGHRDIGVVYVTGARECDSPGIGPDAYDRLVEAVGPVLKAGAASVDELRAAALSRVAGVMEALRSELPAVRHDDVARAARRVESAIRGCANLTALLRVDVAGDARVIRELATLDPAVAEMLTGFGVTGRLATVPLKQRKLF